jgi:hypothetical protein
LTDVLSRLPSSEKREFSSLPLSITLSVNVLKKMARLFFFSVKESNGSNESKHGWMEFFLINRKISTFEKNAGLFHFFSLI